MRLFINWSTTAVITFPTYSVQFYFLIQQILYPKVMGGTWQYSQQMETEKNVLFAWLKYAVSSLSISLHSILLILLLNQVLGIAPYTYAEKSYWGFYYFLWDCYCYQRGYVTCSLHRKQVVKQRFKHRTIQLRSLNTWSLASIMYVGKFTTKDNRA